MIMPFSAINTISLQNCTSPPTSFQNIPGVNPPAMLSTTALPLPAFVTPVATNTNTNTNTSTETNTNTLRLSPPPTHPSTTTNANANANVNTHATNQAVVSGGGATTSFSSSSATPSLPLFIPEARQSNSQQITHPSASVSTGSNTRLPTPQITFAATTMQTLPHPLTESQVNQLTQHYQSATPASLSSMLPVPPAPIQQQQQQQQQ